MTTPIKPRVDEHGTPFCTGCDPKCEWLWPRGSDRIPPPWLLCEPAVRDLAVEVDAWRGYGVAVHRHGETVPHPVDAAVARTDAWRKP